MNLALCLFSYFAKTVSIIFMAANFVSCVNATTTLLHIESSVSFLSKSPNPLALNMPVVIELTYDHNQAENQEAATSDPNMQAANLASSTYTITNGSAKVTIGSYVWNTTSYDITLRNDAPFLTPQDSVSIYFYAPPPAAFASLGFNEALDYFDFFIQDYSIDGIEPMNFISTSSLPTPNTVYDLNLIDQSDGGMRGDTIPYNWGAGISVINKITVTSIPEPQSSIFIIISALIFVLRRRKIIT